MANGRETNAKERIRVYGTAWCPDCMLAKRVLDEFGVDYQWIDITPDEEATAFVRSVNGGNRSVPTILFVDGRTITEPTAGELAAELLALGYSANARAPGHGN